MDAEGRSNADHNSEGNNRIYRQRQHWGDRDVILCFCEHGSVQIHLFFEPTKIYGFDVPVIIGDVWVDEDHRGLKLGSRLMQIAEKLASDEGFSEVFCECNRIDSDEWCMHWHLRNGYVKIYEKEEYALLKKLF